MPSPPKTIRYRDAADLERQLQMVRVNALARALQQSTLVQPLRAPQSIPHKASRAVTLGGEEYERVECLKAQYEARHQNHLHALRFGSAAQISESSRLIDETEKALLQAQRNLEAVDTSRGSRDGIMGLYEITVPPVLLHNPAQGIGEGMRAGERWTLDTRGWVGERRAGLFNYQRPENNLTPCQYAADRMRYKWRSAVMEPDRVFLLTAMGLTVRSDIEIKMPASDN